MSVWDYLSAAGWMRLSQRRDDALVEWLRQNPHSEVHEAADALGRSRRSTHRRLLRLEREGRVRSTLFDGPVFTATLYETTPPHIG